MLKSFHLQTAYTVHVCIEGTRALCCSGLLVGFGKSEDWEKCLHKLVFEKMLLSLITAFTQISGAVSVQWAKKSKTRIISDWYRHIKWILLLKKTFIFDPRNGNYVLPDQSKGNDGIQRIKNRLLLFLSFQHASFIKITNKISFDKYHLK